MSISIPTIDDRNYEAILAEALARIPVHNPQWTNFNDSDPGITLLQLFAFMTDSLLYRANRIPERNRRQFLALLDLPLRPAAAAQGLVTFSNPRGSLTVHTLPDALTVSAGSIPFRTQDGLDVLPLEAMAYYKQTVDEQTLGTQKTAYEEVYASLLEPGDKLTYYETVPLAAPVNGAVYPEVDLDRITNKSLWLALLARSAEEVEDTRKLIANKTLTLGILPVLASDNVALTKVMYPAGTEVAALSRLVYEMPKVGDSLLPDDPRQRVPQYEQLPNVPSGDLLAEPGVVEIRLPDVAGLRLWQNMEPAEAGTADFPPVIEDTETAVRLITWLRIRLQSAAVTAQDAPQLRGRLSWVGINAARVTQRVRVFAENLGRGSGEPDQSVTLINTPVIPDSVTLTVGGETWTEVNDLLAAAPEVPLTLLPGSRTAPPQRRQNDSRVFAVDYESGTIRCGDGLRGMRWPRNAILRATYDYGGGRQGNVGIGAITKATTLPNGVKATNPIRTWGGDEAETVAAAEKRIPAYLQHRDRLVSDADFGEIIEQTPGVEIGRHNVLSLVHPNITDADAPGVVTIVVIPAHDPLHPNAPQPDQLFLQSVCQHLEPRRLITTELHVRGPEYVPIWLSVGLAVIPGTATATVREAVKQSLRRFLSPLRGGFAQTGWPLGKTVAKLELWAQAASVAGVAQVTEVLLAGVGETAVDEIPLARLQLPQLMAVEVQVGPATPLAALRGDTVMVGTGDGIGHLPGREVAVPIVDMEC